MDVTWQHPFTCIVAGPTGSGKSTFVDKLILNASEMIFPLFSKIYWCYGAWQDGYDKWRGKVHFIEGLPDNEGAPSPDSLLIIDDLMHETNDVVSKFFTKGSHHRKISVIYIVQNVFGKSKEMRTISLNAKYLVLFKNPRDASQVTHLSRQMYPGKSLFFQDAFKRATSKPFGYLVCDLNQDTPEPLRLRTRIFPEEKPQIVYVPK